MQIKRFEARDMSQALKRIKQEFGPDAVILSARALKEMDGLFGFFRKPRVEITAATDISSGDHDRMVTPNRAWVVDDHPSNELTRTPGTERTANLMSFRPELNTIKPRYLCFKERNQQISSRKKERPTPYQQLIDQEVNREIALLLTKKLEDSPVPHAAPPAQNHSPVHSALVGALEHAGITTSPLHFAAGRNTIAAFVGPTGVGKTTTIMKLAAMHALRDNMRVALITLDADRIAAIEQLRIFAKIVGLPLGVAFGTSELHAHLKRFQGSHLILVDTPGMSQKNQSLIDELQRHLDGNFPIETHLVLSATTREKDLVDIIQRFRIIPIHKLLFTKMDECICHGHILNQLFSAKLPISYITTGQQIPEDIEAATLPTLAGFVIPQPAGRSRESDLRAISGATDSQSVQSNTALSKEGYVANRKSALFHTVDCKWVKQIKPENLIVFRTEKEAMSNTFKPCRSCCTHNGGIANAGHILAG